MNKQAEQAEQAEQAARWQRRADLALDAGHSSFAKGKKEYAEYCFAQSDKFQKMARRYGSTKYLANQKPTCK